MQKKSSHMEQAATAGALEKEQKWKVTLLKKKEKIGNLLVCPKTFFISAVLVRHTYTQIG